MRKHKQENALKSLICIQFTIICIRLRLCHAQRRNNNNNNNNIDRNQTKSTHNRTITSQKKKKKKNTGDKTTSPRSKTHGIYLSAGTFGRLQYLHTMFLIAITLILAGLPCAPAHHNSTGNLIFMRSAFKSIDLCLRTRARVFMWFS